MWVVKFGDGKRHSAWTTKKEAIKQANVLDDKGYIKVDYKRGVLIDDFIEFDSTVECENGHYYV